MTPEEKLAAQRVAKKKYKLAHKDRAKENRMKLYGLSQEAYDALLEKQDYRCAVCNKPFALYQPCVDHDHKTGRVRGILCHNCNIGIGKFNDKPALLELASLYLKQVIVLTDEDNRFGVVSFKPTKKSPKWTKDKICPR
jgi:hypothetical protein